MVVVAITASHAGIVRGSAPAAEFAETELKMTAARRSLAAAGGSSGAEQEHEQRQQCEHEVEPAL